MSLSRRGNSTSPSEVTNIGLHGFWFLDGDREFFVPFADYPEFRDAPVARIHAMRRSGPGQFHWPELDIDIETAALEAPSRYPLKFRRAPSAPKKRATRPAAGRRR